jgi:hypothetical protein
MAKYLYKGKVVKTLSVKRPTGAIGGSDVYEFIKHVVDEAAKTRMGVLFTRLEKVLLVHFPQMSAQQTRLRIYNFIGRGGGEYTKIKDTKGRNIVIRTDVFKTPKGV